MSWHNHGLNGTFKGYSVDRKSVPSFLHIFSKQTLCRIKVCKTNPWYFIDSKNRKLTTRWEYDSDRASVPFPFSLVWSPELLEMSGLMHDDGCKNEGLFQIMDDGSQVFIRMSRLEMDRLIAEMAPEECRLLKRGKTYQRFTEHCIFWGVRLGAYFGVGAPDKRRVSNPSNKPK